MRNDTQKVIHTFHLTFSGKEKKLIENEETVLSDGECVLYLAFTNLSIVTAGQRRIHVAPDTLVLLTDHRVHLRQPGVFKPMIDDILLSEIESVNSREDSENAGHLLFTSSGKSYDIMLALSRELREKVLKSVSCAMKEGSVSGQEAAAANVTANERTHILTAINNATGRANLSGRSTAETAQAEHTASKTAQIEHTASKTAQKKSARAENYRYFSHKACEYFPCHKGADPDNFNCLFCYCPFYLLGDQCGGNFRYLSTGIKDCTDCLYPHLRENYDEITARYQDIRAAMPCPRENFPE